MTAHIRILQSMARRTNLSVIPESVEKERYSVYDSFLDLPRYTGDFSHMHVYLLGRDNEQENVYRMTHNTFPRLLKQLEDSVQTYQIGSLLYTEFLGLGFEIAKCDFTAANEAVHIILGMHMHLLTDEQQHILQDILSAIAIVQGGHQNA